MYALSEVKPVVSVIIPSYNTKDLLCQCIRSIPDALVSNELGQDVYPYEVIVVDNCSSDGSTDIVRHNFHGVRLISNEKNVGFAKAINQGAAMCGGDFILVSNSDVIYPAGSIASMVQYLKSNPAAGIVGPQLVYPDGSWQRSYGEVPSIGTAIRCLLFIVSVRNSIRRLFWPSIKIDHCPRRVGYVDGAAMLIRKEVWDAVRGFDERFFFYAEDADICHRVRKTGYNVIFLPQVQVVHQRGCSSSSVGMENSVRLKLQSDFKFVYKHWGATQLRLYMILTQIYAWERMMLGRILSIAGRSRNNKKDAHQSGELFQLMHEECSAMRKRRYLPT